MLIMDGLASESESTSNPEISRVPGAPDARRRVAKLYSHTASGSQRSRWGAGGSLQVNGFRVPYVPHRYSFMDRGYTWKNHSTRKPFMKFPG